MTIEFWKTRRNKQTPNRCITSSPGETMIAQDKQLFFIIFFLVVVVIVFVRHFVPLFVSVLLVSTIRYRRNGNYWRTGPCQESEGKGFLKKREKTRRKSRSFDVVLFKVKKRKNRNKVSKEKKPQTICCCCWVFEPDSLFVVTYFCCCCNLSGGGRRITGSGWGLGRQ